MTSKSTIYNKIDKSFIDEVSHKLQFNKKVHRRIYGNGLLHIDRQLPFLCVYRLEPNNEDLEAARLLKGEASYFIIPTTVPKARVSLLIKKIVEILSDIYGAFLLVDIWLDSTLANNPQNPNAIRPKIIIHADTSGELISTCENLQGALSKIKIQRKQAEVSINYRRITRQKGKSPLLSKPTLIGLKCYSIGIAIKPIHRNIETGEFYPLVSRKLHAGFSYALKHAFFEFSNSISRHNPRHYHSLGARAVTKITYEIDKKLAHLSSMIDFLLWVTPINTDISWRQFKKNKFEKKPVLNYRPIPVDPARLKEQLYGIEIKKVHDPTLQSIFLEKRSELDRQLTMLYERNTKNFLLSSMQLYGRVEDTLFDTAVEILHHFPERSSDDTFSGKHNANDFANIAKNEIKFLKKTGELHLTPKVIITDEVSGLMVNKGNLYVGSSVKIPKNRVNALLQHEVGTHIVSFVNGSNQPIKLFSYGLPDYDELQEGLAVLAEFLVGQLSRARIRLLAGRVVAARLLEEGARFIEVFQYLVEECDFEEKTAYRITVRVFRGGGLTKDAIYLRGFNRLLKYIQTDNNLEVLFAGKFSQDQIPIVKELLYRGILKKPIILPSYVKQPETLRRLQIIKQGLPLIELLEYM